MECITVPVTTHFRLETHCDNCILSPMCLPAVVSPTQRNALIDIVGGSHSLRRGEVLFHEGMPVTSIYIVRAGALKTTVRTAAGEEQVVGFNLPGELLGMDSIGVSHHASTATALDTSAVCRVDFNRLERLAQTIPTLQRHLFTLLSAEIRRDHLAMQFVGMRMADQRLATFLLDFSARHKRRKLSESKFRLPMSRLDLSAHLGLAFATISRTFARFQQTGLLQADGKEILITDRDGLAELARFTGSD